MGAAWYRARAELRERWRATLLLSLIVGIAGGVVLTTVAGARRSSTAYDRFREETLASDLDVAFDGPPTEEMSVIGDQIRALPGVAVAGLSVFPFLVPEGSGFYPYLDFLALAPADDGMTFRVDVPRIVEGRLPSLDEVDHIAISKTYQQEARLEVGDRINFESFAPDQLEPLFTTGDAGPPAGPHFTLEVAGVFDAPTFVSESSGDFTPRVFLTTAFYAANGDDIATYPGGFSVRLRDGVNAAEVTRQLREMFTDAELELTPATEVDRKVDSSIDVIVTALLLCALIAAIAGIVAIAQALTRHLASSATDAGSLASLGMTGRQRAAALVCTTVPIALGGTFLAVLVAWLASPLMPVGVARRAEPDPGRSIDGAVFALGAVGIAVVVTLLAAVAATAVARARRLADARTPRLSRSMQIVRRSSAAPSTSIGVGMAIEPRAGTGWAVRSALGGVAFGAMGLVAVIIFGTSVTELVDSPPRWGAPFDAAVSGFSGDVLDEGGEEELLADPTIAQLGVLLTAQARIGGDESNTHAVESLKGRAALTMLDGHAPSAPTEVVLGTRTMNDADVGIGDDVDIKGAGGTIRGRVVGTASFPIVDERSSPGRGILMVPDDLEAISSGDEVNRDVVIRWKDGVDVAAANEALAQATGTEVSAPRLPSDVNNLQEVEELPRALAVFLAILAALAATHALVSTVRLRRNDLAILSTLGFQRRQLAATLAWQATAIATIGLLVGVPAGVVVGRQGWRALASGIGVVDDPVTPLFALVTVVLVAILVANLAAIVPGRRARKVRPAAIFRTS